MRRTLASKQRKEGEKKAYTIDKSAPYPDTSDHGQ